MAARRTRRTRFALEGDLHRAVAQFLDLMAKRYGFVWTTVPGGDGRMTRAPGYRAGWPDVLLIWPRAIASMIELKREKGGVVSEAQSEVGAALRTVSCLVTVARSIEDVAAHLKAAAALIERDDDLGVAA